MEERRKYVRIPEDARISYRCIPKTKMDEYKTKDISQGGIRFLVRELIPKGSYLNIRIALPGALGSLELMGKLVWIKSIPRSSEYEVGVQFVDMPAHAAQRLISYIKNFLKTGLSLDEFWERF